MVGDSYMVQKIEGRELVLEELAELSLFLLDMYIFLCNIAFAFAFRFGGWPLSSTWRSRGWG